MASHRQNINLELVFLLPGVEPLKCIHQRWVALEKRSVGSGMEDRKIGEAENENEETDRGDWYDRFGNLEEVRPGEHEWGSKLAF